MFCKSCRRAIALPKVTPSTVLVRAAAASSSIATRSFSQLAFAARPSTSSSFACRSSLQTIPRRAYSATPETSTPSTLEKPDHLDAAESTIWDLLVTEFDPSELVVQDVSGGCGSMYAIDITSAKFKGANMLKQQRMVNAVLGDMLKQWHGVQLRTKAP